MGNVAKLNICQAFWRVMALAGDIGGGLVVTLPSLKELHNPEVKDFVKEFYSFGSEEPAENIMKVHKLLQHWTAGPAWGGHLAWRRAAHGPKDRHPTGG